MASSSASPEPCDTFGEVTPRDIDHPQPVQPWSPNSPVKSTVSLSPLAHPALDVTGGDLSNLDLEGSGNESESKSKSLGSQDTPRNQTRAVMKGDGDGYTTPPAKRFHGVRSSCCLDWWLQSLLSCRAASVLSLGPRGHRSGFEISFCRLGTSPPGSIMCH